MHCYIYCLYILFISTASYFLLKLLFIFIYGVTRAQSACYIVSIKNQRESPRVQIDCFAKISARVDSREKKNFGKVLISINQLSHRIKFDDVF